MRWPLALVLALAACVEKNDAPEGGKQIDRAYVQENLLDAPPADLPHRVDATFTTPAGGKVVYLGNQAEATRVAPGDKAVVVHYWEIVEPPGAGWKLFSHLTGEQGDFMNVDLTDMRTGHPVKAWKAGQVIRDEQSFVVKKDWKSAKATLIVGFYQPGKHRVEDRMEVAAAGAPVAARAVTVAVLDIDLSKAPPPPGTLILPRAAEPLVIDGKADEPAWQRAAVQTSFTSAEGCPEMTDTTSAKMLWDEQNLYLFVSSEDADVFSPFTRTDDHLWEHDVVEVFVDADGNRRGYIELQINPRNVHFDTWFAGGRPNRDDSFSAGMQSQVLVRGTVDNRDDGDTGWDVEVAIPLAAARGKDPAMKIAVPPRVGDTWRLNVVRADKDRAGKVRAASWNRIGCEDFHALDKMLTVQFANPDGTTRPPPVEVQAPPVVPEPAPAPAPAGEADAGPEPAIQRAPRKPAVAPPVAP
jgi:hypothetical protein